MKKLSVLLRTAVLFSCISAWAGESAVKTAAPAPAAEQPEQAKPLNPGSLVGSVKIGDATIVTTPGGKSEVLIESGNTVIFQKNGASTFTEVPRKGETPQFVHDSGGKVVGRCPSAARRKYGRARIRSLPRHRHRPVRGRNAKA